MWYIQASICSFPFLGIGWSTKSRAPRKARIGMSGASVLTLPGVGMSTRVELVGWLSKRSPKCGTAM